MLIPILVSLQPIIIQRFIINLQHAAAPVSSAAGTTAESATQSHGLSFRHVNMDSIVGDMGQSLEFAHDYEEDEMEDACAGTELDEICEVNRTKSSNDLEARANNADGLSGKIELPAVE